jgi:hypothetical protein
MRVFFTWALMLLGSAALTAMILPGPGNSKAFNPARNSVNDSAPKPKLNLQTFGSKFTPPQKPPHGPTFHDQQEHNTVAPAAKAVVPTRTVVPAAKTLPQATRH